MNPHNPTNDQQQLGPVLSNEMICEVNFDGLVGPTHNYAGLAFGNLASDRNRNLDSSPRQAALQGLEKMRRLADQGVPQAILPPQLRPDLSFLRSCGFVGSAPEVIRKAAETDPRLLAAASSAASMWTANAATISPAVDTADQRLHCTPANLSSSMHRSLEAIPTTRVLSSIFSGSEFEVHPPLPQAASFSDEGAANQMRVAASHADPGIEIFVHGKDDAVSPGDGPSRFPARQTLRASQAIARRHLLRGDSVLHWRQNPVAIDAGAFHNDVVAVANENVLLCHQDAFCDQGKQLEILRERFSQKCKGSELFVLEIGREELGLDDAVRTYLFNSQLVTRRSGEMFLVAPSECEQHSAARKAIDRILSGDNPVKDALFPDVRQSMQNGGGPACLRLRVPMTAQQLDSLDVRVRFDPELESELKDWVVRHYRPVLCPADLADPELYLESWRALAELQCLMGLGDGVLVERDAGN